MSVSPVLEAQKPVHFSVKCFPHKFYPEKKEAAHKTPIKSVRSLGENSESLTAAHRTKVSVPIGRKKEEDIVVTGKIYRIK